MDMLWIQLERQCPPLLAYRARQTFDDNAIDAASIDEPEMLLKAPYSDPGRHGRQSAT